jgi:hypothetical protein
MVLDGFVRALGGFEAMLAGVAPDRWDAPSPCAGWYAVDVAGHVISDLQAVEAYAIGRDELGSYDARPRAAVTCPRTSHKNGLSKPGLRGPGERREILAGTPHHRGAFSVRQGLTVVRARWDVGCRRPGHLTLQGRPD